MATILLASPTGALINGAEQAGMALIGELVDRGHTIINAFPSHYARHDEVRYLEYLRTVSEMGADAVPIDYGWWLPGDEEFARREISAVRALTRMIRERAVDVVVTNTSTFPWAALAAALTGTPHLWLLHEFATGDFAWLTDRYDFIADYSRTVLCASPSLARDVSGRVADAGRSTPVASFLPFSDVSHVTLAPRSDVRIVVMGAINRRKNQREAVEALGRLKERGVSIDAVFIGTVDDDEYVREIEERARALAVEQQLTLLGHAENPWANVGKRDIVVQCSTTEVFSLVACEAAALGLRLILSDNASSRDISTILGGLDLYELGDSDALSTTIEAMLQDPAGSLGVAEAKATVAAREFTRGEACAPILEAVDAALDGSAGNALHHLLPYVTQYDEHQAEERAILEERIAQSNDYIDGLTAALHDERHGRQLAEQRLAAMVESRTWRISRVLVAPIDRMRRLIVKRFRR